MANELTGDFDVVVEFSVPAINRILAAMHSIERFPHSIAARVDDDYSGSNPDRPTLVGLVDAAGEAIANHQRIGTPIPPTGAGATSAAFGGLDEIVNSLSGMSLGTIEPSHLRGRVQLQVFPPTLELADSSGTRVAVRMQLFSRYFPDPQTPPVAEFIRGELKLTAQVNQVASQVGNIVEIDIKANTVGVSFTPQWSSSPLALEDIAGIELFIRNALKTSFLPSNSTLPSSISHVQFRTLPGSGGGAVAMLLNSEGGPGNPASANNVFLSGGDQFAFGISADYVIAALQPTLDNMLSQPLDPVKFDIDGWVHTWHITYTVTLNDASAALDNDWIVLTLKGHAHTDRSWLPDFDFTVKQKLGLTPAGSTAELFVGDISLDTSSTVADLFKGPATNSMRTARDRSLDDSGAKDTVRTMFDAYSQLGGLLESLLKPPRKGNFQPRGFDLAYSAIDIRPSGIVLHGLMSVGTFRAPHVEFEQVPATPRGPHGVLGGILTQGPDYSALRSWIPGGTIQRFEWKHYGETQPGQMDENKFVLFQTGLGLSSGDLVTATNGGGPSSSTGGSPAGGAHGSEIVSGVEAVSGGPLNYSTMCLTLHGVRLSPGGVVGAQPVTATICGIRHFPIGGDWAFDDEGMPTVAIARKSSDGNVEIAGHVDAQHDATGSGAPNLVVHFTGDSSADSASALVSALRESKRLDAPAALLVVTPPGRLRTTRFVDGVTYAEDENGKWSRHFDIGNVRNPVTLIVAPDGKVIGRQEGNVDARALSTRLRESLIARTPVKGGFLPSPKTGQPAPNFVFEYEEGHQVTLSKITGARPVVLHFFRGKPSVSVRGVKRNGKKPIVLAIGNRNAGLSDSAKRQSTRENDAIVVPDPRGEIASAYGITAWPTTVVIDSLGNIESATVGATTGHHDE